MDINIDLSVELFPGFIIDSPFGIASCHLTENRKAIEAISKLNPSFFTLKTTSIIYGGNGKGKRLFFELKQLTQTGTYLVDGPRAFELLDLEETINILDFSVEACAKSIIGVSILAGEDYEKIFKVVEIHRARYIELCYRYIARKHSIILDIDPPQFMKITFEYVYNDLKKALSYTSLPILIKLARDIPWITSNLYMHQLLGLAPNKLGFILADTTKNIVYQQDKSFNGAITGSILLPETTNIINKNATCGITPIIASGGIMNAQDAFNIFRNGAMSVQLCSTLQKNHLIYYNSILKEFKQLLQYNDTNFNNLMV